jgi:hypothetical protein
MCTVTNLVYKLSPAECVRGAPAQFHISCLRPKRQQLQSLKQLTQSIQVHATKLQASKQSITLQHDTAALATSRAAVATAWQLSGMAA